MNLDIKIDRDLFPNETFRNMDFRSTDSGILYEYPEITTFVHCAGYGGPFHPITEVEEDEWDSIFSINLKSAYQILKVLLPLWQKTSYGRFVGIASSLSILGSANSVAYSASKHGLIGLVRSIADEWGKYGITSNAISPGYVETKMGVQESEVSDHRNQILNRTPSKKIASPEEIARVVVFLLDEKSSYINGANWTVDGGITAVY